MSIESSPQSDPLVSWSVPYADAGHASLRIAYHRDALADLWLPLQLIGRTYRMSAVYLMAVLLVETALHPDPQDPGKLKPLPGPIADSLRTVYSDLPTDVTEPYREIVIAAHHLAWSLFENDDYLTALLVFRYGPVAALAPSREAERSIEAYAEGVFTVFNWLMDHEPWRARRRGGAL